MVSQQITQNPKENKTNQCPPEKSHPRQVKQTFSLARLHVLVYKKNTRPGIVERNTREGKKSIKYDREENCSERQS
jgi:hypothetical protein